MLEPVDDEAFERFGLQNLVFHYHQGIQRANALHIRLEITCAYLYFGEEDEGVEVVMREDNALEFRELLQLFQVLMVHDQVEPHVGQVHLLHLVVELAPLQHLQGVAEDVEDLVRLDLRVARLHE